MSSALSQAKDAQERNPRLAEFTDNELRRELRVRDDQQVRARLDSLGLCPECGAPISGYESNVIETFRSAPKWQGWPAPPPPHMEQIDGHRWAIKLVCENGHETFREEVRFKDAVKG